MVTTHEQTVAGLEHENVHINRQAEERQLLWEQREAELERMIDNLERQQREIADAAVKVRTNNRLGWDFNMLCIAL